MYYCYIKHFIDYYFKIALLHKHSIMLHAKIMILMYNEVVLTRTIYGFKQFRRTLPIISKETIQWIIVVYSCFITLWNIYQTLIYACCSLVGKNATPDIHIQIIEICFWCISFIQVKEPSQFTVIPIHFKPMTSS